MRFFLFTLILSSLTSVLSFAQIIDPNSTSSDGAGNPSADCTNCTPGRTGQQIREQMNILNEASTCPENVRQIRLLMASTYGSCDAIGSQLTESRMITLHNETGNGSPNRLGRSCRYIPLPDEEARNCANIQDYDQAVRSHPYNSLTNKCEGVGNRCTIAGELRACPSFYYAGIGPALRDNTPYTGSIENIDPARQNNLSTDINGKEFIGWNCSEYVATAMRLAGHKMICDKGVDDSKGETRITSTNWWNVRRMSEAADEDGECSCMDVVDLSEPEEEIKPGDILLHEGHVMMIEAVNFNVTAQFIDPPLTETFPDPSNPEEEKSCEENKLECIKYKCSEDRMKDQDIFAFTINHSADDFGGIGASSMDYEDYRNTVSSYRRSRERKHMSYICHSRLCKKHGIEGEFCEDMHRLANKPQINTESRFFKVIRHNSEKEDCVDENPPTLTNPCGDTCDDRAGEGCLIHGIRRIEFHLLNM